MGFVVRGAEWRLNGPRWGGREGVCGAAEAVTVSTEHRDMPTSPVLPVGEVGGDGDPPALPHAGALQPLVHPGDDVTPPHVGVVGVVAGVAARQSREGGLGGSKEPLPFQLRPGVTPDPASASCAFLPAPNFLLQTPPKHTPGIKEGAVHQ